MRETILSLLFEILVALAVFKYGTPSIRSVLCYNRNFLTDAIVEWRLPKVSRLFQDMFFFFLVQIFFLLSLIEFKRGTSVPYHALSAGECK